MTGDPAGINREYPSPYPAAGTHDYPLVNGQPIGAQARKLTDNDVLQLAGVKMGFFAN